MLTIPSGAIFAHEGMYFRNGENVFFPKFDGSPVPAQTSEAAGPEKPPSFWTRIWQSATDEANISVGIGRYELALDVKRNSDGASGKMVQRDNAALFLSYSTRPTFIKKTNFGYTFMVNYVNFDLKHQETLSGAYVDLGTEVKGTILYAVPTLYYQWGEHRYNGTFVRLGVGIGIGTATYSGTIALTDSAGVTQTASGSNKSYSPRLTTSNFLMAQWRHMGISFSYASPHIYGDTYDIKVVNYSLSIGYTYYF
jgi:hypothetical protein